MIILFNASPIISYNFATLIMYKLSIYNKNKLYNKYTGWSRLQILFCIPFLFIKYHNINSIASDLIYLNSFGCAISVHIFYILSNYKVLDILASRSLKKFKLYNYFIRYKIIIHLLADGLLHWTPAYISYLYIDHNQNYSYKKYIWLIPACSHVIYPYILTKSFNPTTLYDINIVYPEWKYMLGWILTFIGYFIVSKLFYIL